MNLHTQCLSRGGKPCELVLQVSYTLQDADPQTSSPSQVGLTPQTALQDREHRSYTRGGGYTLPTKISERNTCVNQVWDPNLRCFQDCRRNVEAWNPLTLGLNSTLHPSPAYTGPSNRGNLTLD